MPDLPIRFHPSNRFALSNPALMMTGGIGRILLDHKNASCKITSKASVMNRFLFAPTAVLGGRDAAPSVLNSIE